MRKLMPVGLAVVVVGLGTGRAWAQPLSDGFESYPAGDLPGGRWRDIWERLDEPTVPPPTAVVIETTGADGTATRAVRNVDALGTSTGVYAAVEPTKNHSLTLDVRVDQFSDAQVSWPIAVGYLQDLGASDFNNDPQAVVYTWKDRKWHLFVKNNSQVPGGIDVRIPAGAVVEGAWYRVRLDADTETGAFYAAVFDGATGDLLGQRTLQVNNWRPEFGIYDAIAAFDGDVDFDSATKAGFATIDNVVYVPGPGAGVVLAGAVFGLARRRRCGA